MRLSQEPGTLAVYATDNSIYQVEPAGVLVAASTDDIVELVVSNRSSGSPRPLVARGAGTGTNGQSLTEGLAIDTKRVMNQVLHLDVEACTVVVQPGIVTAELNQFLRPHGLFWPPSTSTVNRCTVGGMIATDAAGQGSLLYGRTNRHVRALDVVLDDGTVWHAEPTTVAEAERLSVSGGRVGALWRSLLELPDGEHELPELARGFSGYGIDRLRRDDLIDPVALLVGSEGTLAITVAATLALTPIPTHDVLVVAGYPTFGDALEDSLRLRGSAPSSIETIDEYTLRQGRASTAWPLLEAVIGHEAGSILLIEYTGEAVPEVGEVEHLIRSGGRATSVLIVDDPAVKAAAWKVRADAVGLLAKVAPGEPRPTAFVEDCAVPVAEMPAFIEGFRRILDARGLRYGMFGHADVGCVHVRPALDPLAADHERQVAEITAEVVALLGRHGGILWGEHGRGFRGQFASEFLAPATHEVMRRVKSAFDPGDLFNPGKLYRPHASTEPLHAIDGVPTRAQIDRAVSPEGRAAFRSAFSCNGNGLCHNYASDDVMCPSYKVTGDPSQSPKGRADLLRAWLTADESPAGADDHLTAQVATSLSQCLSCAACTGRCPVQVDIPELKSRFFERYYRHRRRPPAHLVLSRFEEMSALAARLPSWLSGPAASVMGRGLGLVDLPVPPPHRRSSVPRFERSAPTATGRPQHEIVLLTDVFTSVFEPRTLARVVEVLTGVGHTVAAAPFTPSGKFDHVKGDRKRFARAAARQAALVGDILDSGSVPVVVDPAVALLYSHEYPAIHPGFPTGVVGLAEVLAARVDRIGPAPRPRPVTLFGHCTERSLAPGWVTAWRGVLAAAGHSVVVVETTCCGMAGVFGHEAGNQEVSKALFERGWRSPLASVADEGVAVATGWSCRSQAGRFGFHDLRHPVHLL